MLRLPDRETFKTFVAVLVRLSVLFAVVYFGCLWLNRHYDFGLRLFFRWELGIPLVPNMVYVYFSIAILFALPLFVLDSSGMRRLERVFAATTVVGGCMFLVLNARLGYAPRAPLPGDPFLFQGITLVDEPRNTVPSLHVAYTVLIAGVLMAQVRQVLVRAALLLWVLLLAVSTLLVHQHHIIDVLVGAALGGAAMRSFLQNPNPTFANSDCPC